MKMQFSPLKNFYADADALLSAERDEQAETVIRHLKTYEGGGTIHQHGGFNRGYYIGAMEGRNMGLGQMPTNAEYGNKQPEVSSAMEEAWEWAVTKGYLRHNPQQPHPDFFLITKEGERVLSGQPARKPSTSREDMAFIAEDRIKALRILTSPDFDFQKLIRFCEELNTCYGAACLLATAVLTRGLLDHVPPIFGKSSFAEVASNYGGKTFKEAMQHLEDGARNIADEHLHRRIRKRETLPTRQQVHFGPMLDVLLAEIIRVVQ